MSRSAGKPRERPTGTGSAGFRSAAGAVEGLSPLVSTGSSLRVTESSLVRSPALNADAALDPGKADVRGSPSRPAFFEVSVEREAPPDPADAASDLIRADSLLSSSAVRSSRFDSPPVALDENGAEKPPEDIAVDGAELIALVSAFESAEDSDEVDDDAEVRRPLLASLEDDEALALEALARSPSTRL